MSTKKTQSRSSKVKPGKSASQKRSKTVSIKSSFSPQAGENPGTHVDHETSVKLLSGGNPQIAKGYGDAPVQAYLAAMPDWKQAVGQRLDAMIEQAVPHVYKAVKWNTPLYGIEGQGWFVAFHCFSRHIKVTFFRGTSLTPIPPGASKQKEVRYLDIYEDVEFDELQFTRWVKQASLLPGEKL